MRLLTYRQGGVERAGVAVGEGVVDLHGRMDGASVRRIIAEARIEEARDIAGGTAPDLALDTIEYALPVLDPAKIFCVGVNYANRNEEYKDQSEAPKYPSLFVRTPVSLSPHRQAMVIPRESEQLDYEGEIVLVIGKTGRRIPQARAMEHVAGLTIMDEGSVRDWLRHAKFNVTQGKNFDRSGGLGPWIETDLAALDITDLHIATRVNGEVRQSDTTASMAFPCAWLIAYFSTFATLLPGDLIATGTPVGAGARFDPPKWLRAGDVIEVEVEGVGTLVNHVEAEDG
jgi:2-keto-4-pentenoate hydratase/2-oxohepta-3-ene-1,7-dioic acid hydratase in catechol pathway